MNPLIVYNLAALTIAALYYVWRESHTSQLRRERLRRQRVALMLWSAANRAA